MYNIKNSIVVDYDNDNGWYSKILNSGKNRYQCKDFDGSAHNYSFCELQPHIKNWLDENNISYSLHHIYIIMPRYYAIVLEFPNIETLLMFELMWK